MYKFLLTVIPTLRKGKNSNGYENCINLARIQFKTMYPASELQEYQLSAISNPEKFEINNFYCNSLV
ncbi:MAG: hypothetical protein KDC52_10710, partial [Ignavibacteriae bacterium]|nr:hypothetical protein [Ignavibacteriota bacterium]